MATTQLTLGQQAKAHGAEMRKWFIENFKQVPDRDTIGDWDAQAWAEFHVRHLDSEVDDYDLYRQAWDEGFWG